MPGSSQVSKRRNIGDSVIYIVASVTALLYIPSTTNPRRPSMDLRPPTLLDEAPELKGHRTLRQAVDKCHRRP